MNSRTKGCICHIYPWYFFTEKTIHSQYCYNVFKILNVIDCRSSLPRPLLLPYLPLSVHRIVILCKFFRCYHTSRSLDMLNLLICIKSKLTTSVMHNQCQLLWVYNPTAEAPNRWRVWARLVFYLATLRHGLTSLII